MSSRASTASSRSAAGTTTSARTTWTPTTRPIRSSRTSAREQGSTVGTRGIYANDTTRGYVSAYDDNAPRWAHTAETWWSFFAPRPWLSGGFVWTGFDYRGEPTPYWWPCINSHFGILDTCGFPKDNFYYYQSWWSNQPVLHLLPHWNWPGPGRPGDRRARPEQLRGGGAVPERREPGPQADEAQFGAALEGEVCAGHALGQGLPGRARSSPRPRSKPPAPRRPFNSCRTAAAINADGEDVSVITVSVTDAQGRVVPVADNHIQFDLEGPGRILGVGNGDPSCHEPDVFIPSPAVQSSPGHWTGAGRRCPTRTAQV